MAEQTKLDCLGRDPAQRRRELREQFLYLAGGAVWVARLYEKFVYELSDLDRQDLRLRLLSSRAGSLDEDTTIKNVRAYEDYVLGESA
jgi:hypothetical protein